MIDVSNRYPDTKEGRAAAIADAGEDGDWAGLIDWWGDDEAKVEAPVFTNEEIAIAALVAAINCDPTAFDAVTISKANQQAHELNVQGVNGMPDYTGTGVDVPIRHIEPTADIASWIDRPA